MTDLKEMTAIELAHCLETIADYPHNTGGLSMLDEATLAFSDLSPDVEAAHRELADARHAHKRSWDGTRYSGEKWQAAITAALRLAGTLRPLGDTRIDRCKKSTGLDTCNLPLNRDGTCFGTRLGRHE